MAKYAAEADIVLTIHIEAEGETDPAAIEAAKQSIVQKIAEGSLDLNDVHYLQDISIQNLRRIG